MISTLQSNIDRELELLNRDVTDYKIGFNNKELDILQTRLDTIASIVSDEYAWKLYFIQAAILFHGGKFEESLDNLNTSFSDKGGEFIEGKNLERKINVNISKKQSLLKKLENRPIINSSVTYILGITALIIGYGTGSALISLLGYIFYLNTLYWLIRWLIVDKWGIGYREIVAKICVAIVVISILSIVPGVIQGLKNKESTKNFKNCIKLGNSRDICRDIGNM